MTERALTEDIDIETWKEETIDDLAGGKEQFNREFGCQFLSGKKNLIASPEAVEDIRRTLCEPLMTYDNGCLKIWKAPIKGHTYSLGADVAEGLERCASVIQVVDLTDTENIEQVAMYHSRTLDPHSFAEKILEVANMYGRPWVGVERNGVGRSTIDALDKVHNYHRLLNLAIKSDKMGYYQNPGIASHGNIKSQAVRNWRYWMNTKRSLIIHDIQTLQEIETFAELGKNKYGKTGGDNIFDDSVDALFWALILLDTDVAQKHLDIIQMEDNGKVKQVVDTYMEYDDPRFGNHSMSEDKSYYPATAYFGGSNINHTYEQDQAEMLNRLWNY
jgi:hypothetical protein